ncbi:MAG: 3-oxoacyl-[acyl-carrier-protein] reductase [Christensenellaceae bacterium]|jgi:3-oxoacyl-[acyl-carrier protein] reductase|nr:3-oxoacyl-[acyl-carrier-protein] reductase [Christensenellaceae bacterium]
MPKLALISGASRGIGRAISVALAQKGFDLALLYAGNEDSAAETRRLCEALGAQARLYRCDVSGFDQSGETVKQVLAQQGPISALVNNAGITNDKLLLQMKEEDFSRVLDVNLKGAFNLIRHCAPGFIKRREGKILNISSVAGLMGNAGQANYAAAKAGLIGLTKSVAKELAPRGICCNALAPGFIETDMTAALPATAREALLSAIPLRRAGAAEEVGALAAFLLGESAGYITGAVIPIDGGLSM